MHTVQLHDAHRPFAEIVSLHQGAVYRYLLRFTGSVHDAQDLFQDVFLRAQRAYAALPADADVRAWLMRIATNLTKNHIRDRHRRRRVLADASTALPASGTPAAGPDSEGLMISFEIAQTLRATIDALPFHQRAALVQRQFEGLDYATIAANLGCSRDSARAHVYHALRKLRRALQPPDPTEYEG